MCFFIVILHIFDLSNINNNSFTSFIFRTHQYYVPTFVFISFYFSFITLNSKNISKIKDRFLRIILPYIVWPLFIWIRDIIINYKKFYKIIFRTIILQQLIGFDFYRIFWLQFDLIMVISIFTIIFLDFDKYALLILKLFGLLFYSINKNYEEK